jgi:hypothetical protein
MAVSLLQNASIEDRLQVVNHMRERLEEINPDVVAEALYKREGFWSFVQKRQTMDDYSWRMVEALRFVPEKTSHVLATEMIYMIYCLENGQDYNLPEHYSETLNLAI